MDDNENIKTVVAEVSKPKIDWNKWDVFFSVALVVFIILVPLGGIAYLNGRSSDLFFFEGCFICLAMGSLILVFVIVSTVQFLCNLKRYTSRKTLIKAIQIGIPFVFILSLALSVLTPIETYLWQPGYKPFTYGFREQVRGKADIEDIRDWLKILSKEDCTGERIDLVSDSDYSKRCWPDSIEWPKSLKVFNARSVNLDLDENGKPKIRLHWRSGMGHWGFEIGMEDMEIPPSDLGRYGEYRLPLESGAYVFWYDLQ